MRLLVLGGDGMLGHELLRQLAPRHDVLVTLRRKADAYAAYGLFDVQNSIGCVDVRDTDRLRKVLADVRPDAVVNAVGVVKQRADGQEHIPCLEINALFPHRLAQLCVEAGVRLVHLSTDCVFSGQRGAYTEADLPDARDVYGLTKLLGEVDAAPAITLRSSIIGLELASQRGLVEWLWHQTGQVPGYRHAIYSGLTTTEMSRVIEQLLTRHPDLHGLWHVASMPISKRDLLRMLVDKTGRDDMSIEDDESFHCDRSLIADRFHDATGYQAPSWADMTTELAAALRGRMDER